MGVVHGENQEVTLKVKKKDALLSLFGTMPPRGDSRPMTWEDIRKQAKEERMSKREKDVE
ncbi:hypothetical protein IMZ17_03740 [Geobacillus stearothermophilus]|nr:hypothetical protein IMZ17_03740 [Geobacillus stearothermophilus]